MHSETGTFTDPMDGKIYKTIKTGNQVWMAENLDATKYRNGDAIPNIKDTEKWGNVNSGACCYYDNSTKNGKIYGRLYNWYAVTDPRGLAPEGWHIPSDEEWKDLEIYLGMRQAETNYKAWRGTGEGGKLKEPGTAHWKTPNEGATNETGFTALPGGYRDVCGDFFVLGYAGYFWSSTEQAKYFAWYRSLYHSYSKIHRTNGYVGDGFSVRCIKDY